MMYFISVVIIIVTTLMFVLFASGETDTNNIVFLKGYGWEVRTKSVEKEDIIIPKPFDRVYENYNDIQLKAVYGYERREIYIYSRKLSERCRRRGQGECNLHK